MHDEKLRRILKNIFRPSIKSAGSDEAVPSCLGRRWFGICRPSAAVQKFGAGASFIIRNHSFREAPWEHFDGVVDNLMGTYDIPEPILAAAE